MADSVRLKVLFNHMLGTFFRDCHNVLFSVYRYVLLLLKAVCYDQPEADLGMFSMFGQTGASTKMGPPHEDQKNFCNVPTHRNCPKAIELYRW